MRPMTLQEIADTLGVSKAMVYKIEQRALKKARALMEQQGLTLAEVLSETETEYSIAEPRSETREEV
jgi:DNA-directed RNA polymerase sigma subunit (sigma70/sigma32)